MYKLLIFLLIPFVIPNQAIAQEVWTLDRCINEAVQNNLQLKQSDLMIRRDAISYTTAKAGRFPDLNGSTSFYESFGRQIDPTTNSFNNQNFGNQSYNLQSSVTLFNFNRINNTIKQSQSNLNASEADKEQLVYDISLSVAQAYLILLVSKENLEVAKKSMDQITEQLRVTDKMINAGSKNKNSRLDILAQQAQNETQIITAENDIANGLLNLKQLMFVDASVNIDVIAPAVPIPVENPDMIDYELLVANSLKTQPQFQSFSSQINSALLGEKIAKSQGLPSLGAQASAGTNYSSLNQRILSFSTVEQPVKVKFNNEFVDFAIINDVPITGNNPYFSQLNQNFGYGIGVGLQIPIYNKNAARSAIQNAKLNTESIRIQDTQARQKLRSDIMKSLTDARAARRTLDASIRSQEALEGAYNDAQKRFEIGTANSFELISAKNNLDNAERSIIINKYDYTFKMKVLDYYAGKKITFN
ncbi:MAG: TolC family protein [Saprospiraceae bacterium]